MHCRIDFQAPGFVLMRSTNLIEISIFGQNPARHEGFIFTVDVNVAVVVDDVTDATNEKEDPIDIF